MPGWHVARVRGPSATMDGVAGANSWVKLWWVLWYELLMNAYSPSNIYIYTLIIIIDWCNLIHIHHKYVYIYIYIYIYIHNVNLHFDGDMFQPAQNNRRSLRFYPYPSPDWMCIRLPPFEHYIALESAEVRREIPLVRDLGSGALEGAIHSEREILGATKSFKSPWWTIILIIYIYIHKSLNDIPWYSQLLTMIYQSNVMLFLSLQSQHPCAMILLHWSGMTCQNMSDA